ncbi:MAG: hypothetical protein F6K39_09860 [Okeania sp. SIO3B3]|nr:hypothetical protein [Okeania sp. SIO3B3]
MNSYKIEESELRSQESGGNKEKGRGRTGEEGESFSGSVSGTEFYGALIRT